MADLAALLSALTLDEKVSLVSGASTWYTQPIPRLGIGAMKLSDGPNGVRGDSGLGTPAICFPAAVSLSATFDPGQVRAVGELLALELRRKRALVLLAPTLNIARHPLGGRNFESFGEDPQHVATMGAAYIEGVQDAGAAACAKHFVANDVEYRRFSVSSEIDDRTLREVYLRPFKAAVDAGVLTVMAAYPRLNGVHATEDRGLLTEILRDEWGWDGLVMSDWGATHDAAAPIAAGMDLEMPGPPLAFGDHLRQAIASGAASESDLDDRVLAILRLAERTGRLGEGLDPSDEGLTVEDSVDDPAERARVRAIAADGMVLVHNDTVAGTPVLPLPTAGSVAVIGPNADPGVAVGGGSAGVKPHHLAAPRAGIEAAFDDVRFATGCLAHRYLPPVPRTTWVDEIDVQVFGSPDPVGEVFDQWIQPTMHAVVHGPAEDLPDPYGWSRRYTGRLPIEVAGAHRFGVCGVGRTRVFVNGILVADNWTAPQPGDVFYQFGTAEVTGSIELEADTEAEIVVEWARGDNPLIAGLRFGWLAPVDEDALMAAAVETAAAADAAVVVVGLNAEWETEGHDRPSFELPGRQVELVEAVAAVNDRTVVVVNAGGPVDMPWLDSVGATVLAWYPGQEFGGALADVLSGAAEPGGRSPVTFPVRLGDAPTVLDVPGDRDLLHYREGVFVGHRWYDARELEVAVPFGHGTSYTSFALSDAEAVADGDTVVVSATVTNTGDRAGKAVVQTYVGFEPGPQRRPVRSFGAAGVARLEAGASERLTIVIPAEVFPEWRDEAGRWDDRRGTVTVDLGWSSRDLVTSLSVDRT